MTRIVRLVLVLSLAVAASTVPCHAYQNAPEDGLQALDMVRTWSITLPLDGGESIVRAQVLDDNVYLFSTANRVYAVHAYTGVHRWSAQIGKAGQAIQGPSHNLNYAFFTTPTGVRVVNRRNGEPGAEPRYLRGVIVEVKHDIAEINMGEAHGLKGGEILSVYSVNEVGESEGKPIATIRIESVRPRSAKGQITRLDSSVIPRAGNRVSADLMLPLEEITLPFAASSGAAADENYVYVGAANQKFYSIEILRSLQHWSIYTPNTVVTMPMIVGPYLYIAGQDGLIIACTREDKAKAWTYPTEGPIFADLLVTPTRVFASSSDRSLYCLDRMSGKKLWRERFDSPLMTSPQMAENHVFQNVPQNGLFVLNAEDGSQVWKRPEGGRFLVQFKNDVYLADEQEPVIVRVDAKTGKLKEAVEVGMAVAITASNEAGSIFTADSIGHVACLRSRFAAPLKAADLIAVLHDEHKMQVAAEIDKSHMVAKVDKKPEGPRRMTSRDYLFEQDWLTSHSSAKPVGGHIDEEGEAAEKPAAAKVKKSEKAAESDESADEGDKADASDTKDKSSKDADESGDEDSGDKDKKDADESSDDEGGDKEADSDEESGDGDDKDSDDKDSAGDKGKEKKTGG